MKKHCHGCDRDLPLKAFHKDKYRPDGLQTRCKTCRSEHKLNTAYRTHLKPSVVVLGNTVGTNTYYAPTIQFPTFP